MAQRKRQAIDSGTYIDQMQVFIDETCRKRDGSFLLNPKIWLHVIGISKASG
jgi:hypothetical protein